MSSAGTMSPEDLKFCRAAVSNWMSKKHGAINYLFLEPVDTKIFPTYLDIVQRPMDLGTLSKNLEENRYPTREAFFDDAMLIFDNAQAYHRGKKETQHVIKLAKAMMKLVAKERRKAENSKNVTDESTAKPSSSFTASETGKKAGLKLKLTAPDKTSGADGPSSGAANSRLKPSLTLKIPSALAEPGVHTQSVKDASKPKKPRLKLSLKKGNPATGSLTAPTASSSQAKIQAKPSAGRGGKELPRGVAAPSKPSKKVSTTKLRLKTMKASSGSSMPKVKEPKLAPRTSLAMTPQRAIQCVKVLDGLKSRHEHKEVVWFLRPVSDKAIIDDYRAKIKHPIDLGTMASKLDKNEYRNVSEFVVDLRRIFANCLRYNTAVHDGFRPIAISMLSTAEQLLAYFVARPEAPTPVYPPMLYCWKLCVKILDAILNVTNPGDGLQTSHYFLQSVAFFCGGTFPPDYLAKIKRPMDFGTVTSSLIEGSYQDVSAFASDLRLVIENCLTYYSDRPDGTLIVQQAKRLNDLISQQLDALVRYDRSPSGAQARAGIVSWKNVRLEKPPETWLLGILAELRNLNYTDKYTKITEPAMGPFLKPVDTVQYPDYLHFVRTPMDLETIERKVRSGFYETPEDFEYDVCLIFRNCDAYNAARKSDHLVNMGKFGEKVFRKIFTSWVQKGVEKKRPVSSSTEQQPQKKQRTDSSGGVTPRAVPRISISAARMPPSTGKHANVQSRTKSPKPTSGSLKRRTSDMSKAKDEAPPLHVAIARVKEQFPLRRQYKFLESWESACARFFKELMRHPWISAARPQFIFHVPVPTLFPQLKEAYESKVAKPMDLTTVEAKLLQGGMYLHPQDFIDDVSLVFANAITFNKAGRDEGDPLSCAYYDASIHLLRYTRWLSLEILTDYLKEDLHVDQGEPGLPPFHWKLTHENKKKSRQEMEEIVMDEPIEKSMEGDRYTWTEAECEKLLKALRHMSDLRYMTFFIQPNYPADYTAFISKPMDWEHCQKTLMRREYDTFGKIVEDLRLIFSNALRYNARAKGTETVSGRAYDSAVYMSAKVEAAIDKMVLTVSDRIERERIDHANAEREIAAAERVEAERMREVLKNDPSAAASAAAHARVETIETIRIINKRPRRDMANFEMPFFGEDDDGHREQSHVDAMRLQRATFEQQRVARSNLKSTSIKVGASVFSRLHEREKAGKWARENAAVTSSVAQKTIEGDKAGRGDDETVGRLGSSVLESLNQEGRARIVLKPKKPKKKQRWNQPPGIQL